MPAPPFGDDRAAPATVAVLPLRIDDTGVVDWVM